MISIKSEKELNLIIEAGKVVRKVHKELSKMINPGISTKDLDDVAYKIITENNCIPSFLNYNDFPASICSSINEQVVHGIPSKEVILKEGDIISIDVGASYKGYHADSAWTYGVGNIKPEYQELLDRTKESLYIGIENAISGKRVGDIGFEIENYINNFDYGIIREYSGHGIGTSLHEEPFVPNYGRSGEGPLLKSNMVICIEPMITFGGEDVKTANDNWTVITKDNSVSVHFEHTVIIKDNKSIIVT